jgi:hypothetical protein
MPKSETGHGTSKKEKIKATRMPSNVRKPGTRIPIKKVTKKGK